MKSLKVAAVLAGSLAAAGAAAPAFASDVTPSSLNGGVDTLLREGLRNPEPVSTNALDTEREGTALNALSHATRSLNESGGALAPLLGGLPLGR
ncbi:hypothetical protein [Streptomyces sp. NPDC050560]|uniref:hypothetical protein n=1 Tax=Streptomyces sp. NPDC050560 TaxID=3365630 RepID=UPI00378AA8F5